MISRISLCVTLLAAFAFCSAESELRDWSNAAGKTISAELVSLEGYSAILKMANGRTYTVPLADLSEADREFVQEWKKEQETAASLEEAGIELGIPTKSIVETAFDEETPRTRKGELLGWQAGIGEWRIEEGVLIGDEVAEDNHASSLTYRFEADHLILTAEVQLGTAEQIAFACRDTVPPNLHLGRLYITPDKLWIQRMSGIAKTTKSEKLVTRDVDLDPEKWYKVTIEIIGDRYRAKVGDEVIEATHERFQDAKGIVALVNRGQGAKYRNVSLWRAKPKE
ncbi:MAG: hypothetical protein P1U87_19080 [Verrucomicrobiales bacterium]|nr:hypothetical protein [Verrucomicrobiales bacterium]